MSDRIVRGFAPPLPPFKGPRNGRANQSSPRRMPRWPAFGGPSRHLAAGFSARMRGMLVEAWRRHRTRRCLAGMSSYLLKDIGISYAEAEAEANKPFWVA